MRSCLKILFISTMFASQAFGVNVLVGVYKDSKCKNLLSNGLGDRALSVLAIDLSKKCSTFHYIDRANVKTPGAFANFKCYKEYITLSKYPMSESCINPKMVMDNYKLSFKCTRASSHEGVVYEKIIDYQYPGNEDCTEK